MGCCGGKESSSPGDGGQNAEAAPAKAAVAAPTVAAVTESEADLNDCKKNVPMSFRKVLDNATPEQLLIIRFFKMECKQCELTTDFFLSLATQYSDCIFLDANISRNENAAGELGIIAVPTFLAFKNHKEVARYSGVDKTSVEALVKENR